MVYEPGFFAGVRSLGSVIPYEVFSSIPFPTNFSPFLKTHFSFPILTSISVGILPLHTALAHHCDLLNLLLEQPAAGKSLAPQSSIRPSPKPPLVFGS